MSTKKLTRLALLTAAALIIHTLEALLPPLVPIPGIKLGLANIITLFVLYRFGAWEAVAVTLARVLLGSMFGGSVSALIYSLAGSALSLSAMLPLKKIIPPKYMFLPGILGAAAHNLGQILAAVAVTRTPGLFMYLPVLIFSGCVAGLFTGLATGTAYLRLQKGKTDE
ncbi:MAG: Gx transporter family protein [Clostridia bacterium]|nr:Gx transporter family protein [Clostridia bacterium]MCR4578350.1 Gx transporter family protein [Clostridiales bacterium]